MGREDFCFIHYAEAFDWVDHNKLSPDLYRLVISVQIAVKRREAKSKGEKERYKHLNKEFQRIARRDKKAFFSDQCKETEENNRMGKTRDLQEN